MSTTGKNFGHQRNIILW